MIVFDLKCGAGHRWEGWFGSSADYEAQRERGLVECPVCGDARVEKAVMAPAVPAKSNAGNGLARLRAKVEAECEWVGSDFARRARAAHAGKDDALTMGKKGLYGQATVAEARALIEDGVPVAPLPFRPTAASDA